jgi:hypothetical protein
VGIESRVLTLELALSVTMTVLAKRLMLRKQSLSLSDLQILLCKSGLTPAFLTRHHCKISHKILFHV